MTQSQSLSIVLVDDDRQVRAAGRQTLELAGFSVQCCDSAEAALKLLSRHCGALITDVRMPGMDGFALMERALAVDADLPVIMLTGHGDISMAVRAIRAGAYDFIEKPYPAEILADCVRRALERRHLVMENRRLRQELAEGGETAIIGRTPAIERMRTIIAAVAKTDADVLVMGETGTGKELVARALHHQSSRRDHKFVALNCGAMPEHLFESELFGHEAGSFTGAAKRRVGRIQFADKGTLFLDEIESMPLGLQVKILRVLQERAVEPLGSNEIVPVDIRVVAATKVSLKVASQEQRFREDLYYRLNVVMIHIPPLRERREDIPLLFQHFVHKAAARYDCEPPRLTPEVLHQLNSYSWPGNVRELKNAADRFVLGLGDSADPLSGEPRRGQRLTLAEQVDLFEKSVIENELSLHDGNVKQTVEALGVPRKTFYDKLRRHGVVPDDFR
ncbi:C4-dicarboxylate transport transcriptional regulatory protein DctD [mine drainage metagenome]|uniref:C4-dicarboxylate transport transcriptional regulatory protein DctD n=1 Tax=mine drainage metagenome TaxID=410659 RepID=A0A1J5QYU2_9ZZZZ